MSNYHFGATVVNEDFEGDSVTRLEVNGEIGGIVVCENRIKRVEQILGKYPGRVTQLEIRKLP